MHILFWDIDGTLLRTDRASLYAFHQITNERFGCFIDWEAIPTAGMTDSYIAAEILQLALGRTPAPQECRQLIEAYEQCLPHHLATRQGRLMPSIAAILAAVHKRDDFVSLLLTGNTQAGATAKLQHFQIDRYFDFSASAFGDHCTNRSELAAQALAKVQTRYPEVDGRHIFVIGDTPNDITCGKAIGAHTVAVATGRFALAELETHAPTWAVAELPPPAEFFRRLATWQ